MPFRDMTTKQIATLLGVGDNTVRSWADKDEISYELDELGYRWFDPEEVLDDLVRAFEFREARRRNRPSVRVKHGTLTGYTYCKDACCRGAMNHYMRERRANPRAQL